MKLYDIVATIGEYTDKERRIKSIYRNVGELRKREDGSMFLIMDKSFNLMAVRQKDASSDKVFLSLFTPRDSNAPLPNDAPATNDAAFALAEKALEIDEIPF